jgi:hypothetical protein
LTIPAAGRETLGVEEANGRINREGETDKIGAPAHVRLGYRGRNSEEVSGDFSSM